MSAEEEQFPKPDVPVQRGTSATSARMAGVNGISAVHVTQAREMVNLHLQGRNPQRQQTSRTLHRHTDPLSHESTNPKNHKYQNDGMQTGVSNASQSSEQAAKSAKQDSSAPHITVSSRHSNSSSLSNSRVTVPAKQHMGPCSNPQCTHCGAVIIPSPKATLPLKEQPSISVNDWSIFTVKGPILSSDELDSLNETRFDFPLPEMIFGKNHVRLINDKTGATIEFNTLDALDSLAPTSDFKVAYYKEWLRTRPKAKGSDPEAANSENSDGPGIKSSSSPDLQSVKPYDWTYSTNYKGTLANCVFSPTSQDIPLEKLLRQDPILFYDESILFEDELGDNGISMQSTKIRVMHSCLLLLSRFFMRVDDVAFRVRDTRIYVDLESNLVLREYKVQQASYDELFQKITGRSSDPKKLLRDPNWVAANIPVISRETEVMAGTASASV